MKKTIVLSGINFYEGGGLSVYYDCLDTIIKNKISDKNKIIAFVHKSELFNKYREHVFLRELPKSRKNYMNRLYYEFIYFYRYSQEHHIDIWISLHDITPRVKADKIYTYCHTPSPFMKKEISKLKYSWKIVAFSYFYKYLYRINITSATAIIVQQEWMRKEFLKMYPINNVIVARPIIHEKYAFQDISNKNTKVVFIYASYPRYFKNYEVILKACQRLQTMGYSNFEVYLTIDGTENRYSSELREKYKGVKRVKWLGLISREELFQLYEKANCMIFPSTAETWGLPISEFKSTGKPMILADLPYAHEALGEYDKAAFFMPNNEIILANLMKEFINGSIKYVKHKEIYVHQPYACDWNALLKLIIKDSF